MTDLRKLYNDAYAAQREKDYLESGKGDHFEAQTAAIAAITAHFDEREKAYSASIGTLSDALTGLGRKVTLDYTNHRGERAMRTVTPASVDFGTTEWHPEPGLMIQCYDHDKAAVRVYSWSGVHSWNGVPVSTTSGAVELREALERALKATRGAIKIADANANRVGYSQPYPDDVDIDPILPSGDQPKLMTLGDLRLVASVLHALARPVAEEPAAPVEGEGRGRIAVAVQTMKTSKGADYYVSVACGNRSCTPHMFLDRYKAEYEVAHWQWIFGQRAEEPYILDYSEETYPNLYPKMEPSAAAPKANGVGTGEEGIGLGDAMRIAQAGFKLWADKPHNLRWARKIDGTPIPNDLPINIAQAFVDAGVRAPTPSQGNDEGVGR